MIDPTARRPSVLDATYAHRRAADEKRIAESRARINAISDNVRGILARRNADARAQVLPA